MVIRSASTDHTAERAFSARMKKTMLTARTTLEVMVRPNQAMNRGASAMRGTLLIGARKGPKIEFTTGLRPRMSPARVPEAAPMTKESPTAAPVASREARLRSDGRYSTIAVHTPLGMPNRVGSTHSLREAVSHRMRKAMQMSVRAVMANGRVCQNLGRLAGFFAGVLSVAGGGVGRVVSVTVVMVRLFPLSWRRPVPGRRWRPRAVRTDRGWCPGTPW